jgi:hypothetical protein
MTHGHRVKGVYSIPRIWRGPDGEVPEEIRRHGIDPRRLNIDPDKIVTFEPIFPLAPDRAPKTPKS